MSELVKKKYYKILFTLMSPLSIGSGENQTTDKDIVLNSKGEPYIPGSALAGMYRACMDEEIAKKYFGVVERSEDEKPEDAANEQKNEKQKDKRQDNTTKSEQSKVTVYDAELDSHADPFVTTRDMVALDAYKTAKPGAKFDFQILEPGVKFVTYLEQDVYEGDKDDILTPVLRHLVSGNAVLGSKVMRGYGHIQAEKIGEKEFQFPNDLETWLDFSVYDYGKWIDETENWKKSYADHAQEKGILQIRLSLSQKGGISVRQYSTVPDAPDYMQMKLHGKKGWPIIPGTSWAGAFRAQLKKLGMKEPDLKKVFGNAGENAKSKKRSRISFTESKITGGNDVIFTRNAIDRFSGGTIDGALYTESTHYNGKTDLAIAVHLAELRNDAGDAEELIEKLIKCLAAAIVDLNEGYLAVGGLTAVGRGMFTVDEIVVNGQKITDYQQDMKADEAYKSIYGALKERTEVQG